MPTTAVQAITGYITQYPIEEVGCYSGLVEVAEETRMMVAKLMHVSQAGVAFTRNTSSGIMLAIGSVEWQPGDNVILVEDSFPAMTCPFRFVLPDVERRLVTSDELLDSPDCIMRLADGHTRMVVVPWVHFLSGARFDVRAIATGIRQNLDSRNVLLVIDAMQGLGAVEENFGAVNADFVCSGAPKWLLGPPGIGFVHVNLRVLPRLRSWNMGWISVDWDGFNRTLTPREPKPDASRYEEGTRNYIGMYGLRESIRLLLDVGMPTVSKRVRSLVSMLRTGLSGLGFESMTPASPERSAGIITCRKPGVASSVLYERLRQDRLVCSMREDWLRISPHFYNSEEEVERFVQNLAQ